MTVGSAGRRSTNAYARYTPPFLVGCVLLPLYLIGYAVRGGFRRRQSPIFVVGCGHSGTTLMRVILGRHRDVYGIDDESAILVFPPEMALDRRLFVLIGRNPYRQFFRWQSQTLRAGKHHWAEKTPRHIYGVDLILRLNPRARVVMMTRDPRDVVASLMERGFDFRESLGRWETDNERLARFRDHARCLTVHYEDLVVDPEAVVNDVSRFCGIAYEPGMLLPTGEERHETRRLESQDTPPAVRRHVERRVAQINADIFDGRGRWREELTDEQVSIIDARTVELQRLLGYEPIP